MTSGISGDMALSALIALGLDENQLSKTLSDLIGSKINISTESVYRNSISARLLKIDCADNSIQFKGFSQIRDIISSSTLSDTVISKSISTFKILADAEASIHNIPLDDVHFHEIGAIDTIIDIVGVAYGLEVLGIDLVYANKPILGSGTVETEHGTLPLPAPATLRILNNIDVKRISTIGETTTPTGAAILRSHVTEFKDTFEGKIVSDAYSTGNYTFEGMPNLLRAILIETNEVDKKYADNVYQITTNIDDMSGEAFGYLIDKLISIGSYDVSYIPAFGKKNRPLYILSVIIPIDLKSTAIDIIFRYSTTAGVRLELINRVIMSREYLSVEVDKYKANIKKMSYNNIEKISPEWQDCIDIAEQLSKSPLEIYNIIMNLGLEKLNSTTIKKGD